MNDSKEESIDIGDETGLREGRIFNIDGCLYSADDLENRSDGVERLSRLLRSKIE